MQDALIEMGRYPLARHMLKRFGIHTPPPLMRSQKPWSDELLQGKNIGTNASGYFIADLSEGLIQQNALVTCEDRTANGAREAVAKGATLQGTLFDATAIQSVDQLQQLYTFFRSLQGRMGSNHRIVVLIPSDESASTSPEQMAINQAIGSFTKSLAKEFGPRGININAIRLPLSPNPSLQSVVNFLLSDFCAFITGQIITLSASDREVPLLAGSLAGKKALVTGAAQGIGYAICQRLAEEGAHVICLDRPSSQIQLDELAQTIEGESFTATLGEEGASERIAGFIQDKMRGIDILVHNAGVTRDSTLFNMRQKQWDEVMNVNLKAIMELTHSVLHRGQLKRGGRIICMSSLVGLSGNFGQSNYSASKGGLVGYVKGLSQHLLREQATANAIAPGFIETSMTEAIPFMVKQFARRLASLRQGGKPDDVAELACFLASPCAQAITGQTIRVCGGNFMGA